MKKLSLLLALLLVVSCFVLASCGEEEESSVTETSSTATSSAAASSEAESSVEASSEEESSETESSEEESSEPEFVKNPDAVSTEGENVAAGKTYTRSQLYRQLNVDPWDWADDAPIAYPDDNNELTDGVIPADDAAYSDASWMGFHPKCPDYITNGYGWIIVDLEQVYELSELTLYLGTSFLGGGIAAASNVEFLVSEDNENWVSVGSVTPTDDSAVAVVAATLECDVTGRYVQIRMNCGGWNFVGEFEAK